MSSQETPKQQFDAAMQKVGVELTYLARNQNDNHDEAVYDAIRNLAHAVNLLATNATWTRPVPVYKQGHPHDPEGKE